VTGLARTWGFAPAKAASASDRQQAPAAAPAAAPRSRLAWLDALRGIAALCVVYTHFGSRVLLRLHSDVYNVFDPGLYGVLVFFLISGYIVPASLERTGNLRTFWISRLFRLFPLFVVVVALTLVLHLFGLAGLGDTNQDVPGSVLSHLFMLSDIVSGHNLIVVIWTLSYEMVFYLLLTALFTAGLHQRSGTLALTFAGGALLLGGLLPTGWLTGHASLTELALITDVLVIGGVVMAVVSSGRPQAVAAWLAAATGLILVLFNGQRFAYEGLAILALMFTGTIIYRAQHGQVSRKVAGAVVAGVFAAAIAAGAWHIPALSTAGQPALQQREWVVSVALAGLTFAVGLGLQKMRVPRALAWLGLVSYSVYLTFPLLLDVYDKIPFPASYYQRDWLQAAVSVAYLAALLAFATLSYRLVEAPMQRLGRRAVKRLDASEWRFGRRRAGSGGSLGKGSERCTSVSARSCSSSLSCSSSWLSAAPCKPAATGRCPANQRVPARRRAERARVATQAAHARGRRRHDGHHAANPGRPR
jgi:peptidoglycan/LPS O-acetylase OafA/YrhL